MKNKIITTLIIMLVLPNIALADFSAVFPSEPLFLEDNILPGDDFARIVKIYNSDAGKREVYLKTLNVLTDNLAEAMDIKIYDGGNLLVSKTMEDFLDDGWLRLADLPSGAERQIGIQVGFRSNSGNDYQESNLRFDIVFKSDYKNNSCFCSRNCGHDWKKRKWYTWNHKIRNWFSKSFFRFG